MPDSDGPWEVTLTEEQLREEEKHAFWSDDARLARFNGFPIVVMNPFFSVYGPGSLEFEWQLRAMSWWRDATNEMREAAYARIGKYLSAAELQALRALTAERVAMVP